MPGGARRSACVKRRIGPARRLQVVARVAIALEGAARLVRVPAVELDRKSCRRPDGVDLHAACPCIGGGPRQAVGIEECEEAVLQRRPRHRGADRRQLGERRYGSSAWPLPFRPRVRARTASISRTSRRCERSASSSALREPLARDDGGEVDQRPCDGVTGMPSTVATSAAIERSTRWTCHARDAPPAAAVVSSTACRSDDRSACSAAASRWLSAAPGPAASTAASQWPSRVSRAVADRVDAAVERHEAAGLDPPLDHLTSQAAHRGAAAGRPRRAVHPPAPRSPGPDPRQVRRH